MRRKVSRIGPATLMISLPAKWTKKYNINKGSELNILEEGKSLHILTDNFSNQLTTTIDISNLNKRVIEWYISALHKYGYDEIKIIYNSNDQLEIIKSFTKNVLTGFAVVDSTDKSITIKQISSDQEQEFNSVLRRAFMITISLGNRTLDYLKNQKDKQSILDLEMTNNQLTNFCERILNKNIYRNIKKICFYYVIIWNLEKIADGYKHIAQDSTDITSKETIELLNRTNKCLESYYKLFYKFDINELNNLNSELEILKKDIKSIKNDSIILHHIYNLTTNILDFSSSMIILNHN
jgi:phosphate uptake regulator